MNCEKLIDCVGSVVELFVVVLFDLLLAMTMMTVLRLIVESCTLQYSSPLVYQDPNQLCVVIESRLSWETLNLGRVISIDRWMKCQTCLKRHFTELVLLFDASGTVLTVLLLDKISLFVILPVVGVIDWTN